MIKDSINEMWFCHIRLILTQIVDYMAILLNNRSSFEV